MINVEKVREKLKDLENNSERVNRLVDGIIGDYIKDMDEYLEGLRDRLNEGDISDGELEQITIKLPVYIYFTSEKLENLGVESDIAKSMKTESYGDAYLSSEGTIPERESQADLSTMEEEVIERAYRRAYKKLKSKIEKAESVYTGAKKVLDKRSREINLSSMHNNYDD